MRGEAVARARPPDAEPSSAGDARSPSCGPIALDGEESSATVYVEIDIDEFFTRGTQFLGFVGLVLFGALAPLAIGLATRLQRIISVPLLKLTEAARNRDPRSSITTCRSSPPAATRSAS